MILRLSLSVIFLISAAVPSVAQNPGEHLKPTVFAIRDAKVISEPGKVLPKATVIIRDGLIEAVGAEVKPPADALLIDGKGLTVYPGFIDAMSNWGFDPGLRRSEGGPSAPVDFASEALASSGHGLANGGTRSRARSKRRCLAQAGLHRAFDRARRWHDGGAERFG